MNFKFKNNKEFFKALEPEIEKTKQDFSRKNLTALQLIYPYLKVAECKRVKVNTYDDDYIMMYPNYDSQRYTTDPRYLQSIFYEICHHFRFSSRLSDSGLREVLRSDFTVKTVVQHLTMSNIGLIEVENDQIYDVFSKSIVPRDPSVYYYNSYDIDPLRKPDSSSNYYKAAELLFQSWGQNNPDYIRMLKLLVYLAFIGYGSNLWISLVGPTFTGKSTFLNMLINIANRNACRGVDTDHLFSKGNFEYVSPFDKLLIDRESLVDHRFSPNELCELKVFVENDSLRKCTLYAPTKIRLNNRGLKLKEALQIPHSYAERLDRLGSNKARPDDTSVLGRFMMIPFGSQKHVDNIEFQKHIANLTQKSISDLIYDQDFLKEVIAIVLDEFSFKHLEEVRKEVFRYKYKFDSELLSYDLDRFIELCETQQVFTQEIIPIDFMYHAYTQFCKSQYSGFKNISRRVFVAHFSRLLESKGFVLVDRKEQASSIPTHQFNVYEFSTNDRALSMKSRIYLNTSPTSFLYQLHQEHFNDYELQLHELANSANIRYSYLMTLSQAEMHNRFDNQSSK